MCFLLINPTVESNLFFLLNGVKYVLVLHLRLYPMFGTSDGIKDCLVGRREENEWEEKKEK